MISPLRLHVLARAKLSLPMWSRGASPRSVQCGAQPPQRQCSANAMSACRKCNGGGRQARLGRWRVAGQFCKVKVAVRRETRSGEKRDNYALHIGGWINDGRGRGRGFGARSGRAVTAPATNSSASLFLPRCVARVVYRSID